jgi:hypothetical protein
VDQGQKHRPRAGSYRGVSMPVGGYGVGWRLA